MRPYRPDDANLLATVSDFLAKIAPQLNPGDRYQALVCQHILATLGRSADAAAAAGSPSDTGAALAAAIRAGAHDAAWDDLLDQLLRDAIARVALVKPDHLAAHHRGHAG